MKKKVFPLVLCLALAGCASYLAKVNEDVITGKELSEEFVGRHGGHKKILAGPVEIRKFLDVVINKRLLVQEAYRMALDKDPEIVAAAADYEKQLEGAYLIDHEITSKAVPSESEVKSVYDTRLDELVHVQQIVVPSKTEAEEILGQIRAGGDFEAVAREKSIANSAKYDGRVNPIGWGVKGPEWERVVFSLQAGALSPVMKSDEGYEIIRMESRTKAPRPEFNKAAGKIRAILEKRKRAEREKEFFASMRKKYNVQTAADLDLDALKTTDAGKKEHPAATWSGGKLSIEDFVRELDFEYLSSLSPDVYHERIREMLDEVVNGKLVLIEALSRGYDKVPEIIEQTRRFRENLMEAKMYTDYIKPDGGLTASEDELLGYFEGHRNNFVVPETRYVAHIVVKTLETANEVLDKVKQGEPFPDLVKAYSQDSQTVKLGGVLGWVEKKDIPPEFESMVALKTGEVGGPFESRFGYHIIRILAVKPQRLQDFSEVKEEVRKRVLQDKRNAKIKFWTDKLRSHAAIEINDKGIRDFMRENSEP